MLALIKEVGRLYAKKFVIDNENEPEIKKIVAYFFGDPDFEQMGDNYSLNKGLFIFGNTGSGKSVIMKIMASDHFKLIRKRSVVSVLAVQNDFVDSGYAGLRKYTEGSFYDYHPTQFDTEKRPVEYCFDDIGSEELNSKHYGNNINVMELILIKRYNFFQDHGMITHLTSNLFLEQIEKFYGSRIESRFSELFNIICMAGKDRRRCEVVRDIPKQMFVQGG